MNCPYCQTPVFEMAGSCPRCGLNMEKAGAFFGIAPAIEPGINDLAHVINRRGRTRLAAEIAIFKTRFPQCGMTVVFMALDENHPGKTFAFWLFNKAVIISQVTLSSRNREVFLLVDTKRRTPYLTVGYGLEPFVGEKDLRECLDVGLTHFANDDFAEGAMQVVRKVDEVFREIIAAIPRTYGVPAIEASAAPLEEHPQPANAW
jgi:uncharacterized membrane protein YgcG